jgi:hypothetical protein
MADTKIMTIRCVKCKRKVFKYLKVGKGNLLRAYKSKIQAEYFILEKGDLKCKCGHKVAVDKGKYFKMLDQYQY